MIIEMNLNKFKLISMYFKLVALVSTILVLMSCAATTGPSFQEYSDQLSPVTEDKVRLYIYRPTSSGSSVNPNIKLDGKDVGQTVVKGFLVLDIAPGAHTLSASANRKRTFTFFFKKAEDSYIRIEIKRGLAYKFIAEQVDVEIGSAEILTTNYSGE